MGQQVTEKILKIFLHAFSILASISNPSDGIFSSISFFLVFEIYYSYQYQYIVKFTAINKQLLS